MEKEGLIYHPAVKRVAFGAGDAQRLAELREILQRKSAKRLTDSDVLRKAVALALGLVSSGDSQ